MQHIHASLNVCITVSGLHYNARIAPNEGALGCTASCASSCNNKALLQYWTALYWTPLLLTALLWTANTLIIECTIMVCNSLKWCSNKITTQHNFTLYWISFYRSNLVKVPLWFVTTEKQGQVHSTETATVPFDALCVPNQQWTAKNC